MYHPFSTNYTSTFNEQRPNLNPTYYTHPMQQTYPNTGNQNAFCQQPQNYWQYQTPGVENLAQLQQPTPTYYTHPRPNTVTFTFAGNQKTFCQQPQNYWQCQTTGFDNLAQLQQQNERDWLQLQRHLTEPYRLKFHLDNQTSTSDLGAKKNEADFKNLAALLLNEWPPWLQNSTHRDHKKLIVRNVTAKEEGSVVDELIKEKAEENVRRVSFDLEQKKDAECQVDMGCKCCGEDDNEDADSEPKQQPRSSSDEASSDDAR